MNNIVSFRTELEDKVAQVRREALRHFDEWALNPMGNGVGRFNEDRTRVLPTPFTDDLEGLQSRLDSLLSDLDYLESRFDKYRDFDRSDFYFLRQWLCRDDLSAIGGENWDVSLGPQPQTIDHPTKVADMINYAAYRWVLPAADVEGMFAPPVWVGPAAAAFNSGFLTPFYNVAARQIFAGVYLANMLKIYENMVKAIADDLLAICDATLMALDGKEYEAPSEKLSDASLFLDLIGFILPSPLDDLASAGSIALDLRSRQITDPAPPKWQVSWSHFTDEIVAGTGSLLDRLEDDMRSKDEALAIAMASDVNEWSWNMESSTPDPPDQMDEELAADLHSIYEIGKRILPSAANLYYEAAGKVDYCDLPPWFTRRFFRSPSWYEDARRSLRDGMNQTAEHLNNAGQALVDICGSYDIQDEVVAAAFDQFKEELPPPVDPSPMLGRGHVI